MNQTKTLLEVLRRHYIKPSAIPAGGIFIPECGINGPGSQTRADALYVGFTTTSGRLLIGHELKVSRSDWRKELDTAGKADFWADACHEWWVVAPGPEIVPADEVPNGWGLLYPGRAMRMQVAKKAATKPPEHQPPWDAVRSIMARLDTLQSQALLEQHSGEQDRIREQVDQLRRHDAQRATGETIDDETRGRLNALAVIERRLGQPLNVAWGAGPDQLDTDTLLGCLRLARAVRDSGAESLRRDRYAEEALTRTARQMLDGLTEFATARAALLALIGDPE